MYFKVNAIYELKNQVIGYSSPDFTIDICNKKEKLFIVT